MDRRNAAVLIACLTLDLLAPRARAQRLVGAAPRAAGEAPVAGAAAANPNPALSGGILASPLLAPVSLGPSGVVSPLQPSLSVAFSASLPPVANSVKAALGGSTALTLPAAALAASAHGHEAASPGVTIGSRAMAKPGAAMTSVQGLVQATSKPGASANAAAEAGNATFDANVRLTHDVGGIDGSDGAGRGGNGNGGNDGGRLGRGETRAAIVLDTFEGAAPDKVVAHLEKMLDLGVHVVFVTARPEKGENSAESVLVGRMKARTTNPLIVVSYNGARVTAKNSRAENPKPLVEDLPGIPQKTIEKFRTIADTVKANLGVTGAVLEFAEPSVEDAYIYGAELPAGVDAKKWTSTFNRALKDAGFLYKIETVTNAEGKTYFFTQSTALKLNTSRIFNALYSIFPQLDPAKEPAGGLRSEQVLVLANPAKANGFLKTLNEEALRGNGFSIQGAQDAAGAQAVLEAVLGYNALEKVRVTRSSLKDYVSWLQRRDKWGAGASTGAGTSKSPKSNGMYRLIAFYRAVVLKDLMGRLYHSIRKGQYDDATVEAAVTRLIQMWNWPRQQGVRLPAELQAIAYNPAWRQAKKEGLDSAIAWIRNYYRHNFRDFPLNISERVVSHMVNLARDGGNAVKLEYVDKHTGRRYEVGVDPDRVEIREDDKGEYIVTHVYRTGNEVLSKTFHDAVEVNIVGRGALEGYAIKGDDGRWYLNDKPNPRVQVVYHYMTRELPRMYTPEEIEAASPSVTALIERMENDAEYQAELTAKKEADEKAKAAALRVLKRHGKGPKAKPAKGAGARKTAKAK